MRYRSYKTVSGYRKDTPSIMHGPRIDVGDISDPGILSSPDSVASVLVSAFSRARDIVKAT